jgi:two-component system, response regulator YesN
MYRVLIVDDEMPALRFIQSIIEQFAHNFQVVATAGSGEQGFQYLEQHPVDLLITDIGMRGMNGIELAQSARAMQPNIHIVIISGYGEFEYAQGAIQAGVDDYLLKPVSISKMTAILQAIEKKIDVSSSDMAATILPAIACGQPYSKKNASQLYRQKSFYFALIRWGNLDLRLPRTLGATSMVFPKDEHYEILRGRDDDERILISPDMPIDEFISNLSVYMTKPGNLPTWTAVYTPKAREIESLPSFIEWAIQMMQSKAIIGKHQIIRYSGGTASDEHQRLPASDLKQLVYFISMGKFRMIKEYFVSLAVDWEHKQTPQIQAWHMIRQIIYQTVSVYPPLNNQLEEMLTEFGDIIRCAGSYGDLMSSVYTLLFENGSIRDRKLSPQELYDYAVKYIDENYAQPLSMQSVCDEIGISQTYLSRLFRKYSDTTFNAYLTRRRMEAAMKLLEEKPDLLLRDVAACVGYDDSSYFTKVFHQYTGKTPSQFTSES